MIYLIDDKKDRQEKDYSWSSKRLNVYHDILQPIYNLEELQKNSNEIFQEAKVILYHESLTEYARNKGKYLVYFSGGSDTRQIDENIAYIPDSILYHNLDFFLKAFIKNDFNIGYLVYGSDPKLEEKLKNKQSTLIQETEKEEVKEVPGIENLFLRPLDDFISNPISNSDNETLWEASDEYLNEFVEGTLKEKKYHNIFIPLCFGDTLSDFNGLKLAIYIRCCKTQNQLSNLYIYGFVKFSFLVNHSYFDILKTKNIKLIDFSKKAIYQSVNTFKNQIQENELSNEISKIKLSPPKNYNDNHSIANEWAIYRWSKTLNVPDKRLEAIENKIESNLYFKYLKTIYPITSTNVISDDKLKITYSGTPKVLYIDDEVEKGWDEILSYLLIDKNNIDGFDYLIDNFKNISQERLIESVLKKIKDDDIDLVLLDFRLLPGDFNEKNIEEITGVKILNEIKELNPGIQVVIFSATNKIWNLQKLQECGADDFVLKENIINSEDENHTINTIEKFIYSIEKSLQRSFLKNIYKIFKPIIELVETSIIKKPKNYSLVIQQPDLIKYNGYLESADYILRSSANELKYSFLQLILVVEDIIKSFYISDSFDDHVVEVSIYEKVKCISFQNESIKLSLKSKYKNNLNEFLFEDEDLDKNLDDRMYSLFKNKSDRIPFNFRLHCVLHFKYHLPLKDCVQFSDLYRLRSNSVAHMGGNKVGFKDLEKILNLLQILIK
jgi:CheY-like chemotaxis protein